MIDLNCPDCGVPLRIDEGFAGGICRCSHCGALMTVPEDRTRHAEQLHRAERPGRPEAPGAAAPAASSDSEQFVTASGRTVEVPTERLRRVPVAQRKRYGVRIAVVTAFVLIAAGLAVALIVSVANVLQSQQGEPVTPERAEEEAAAVTAEAYAYDPRANPYLIEEPNLFGIPVDLASGRTLRIVVDASAAMQPQIDFAREVLTANLRTLEPTGAAVQVLFAAGGAARAYPAEPQPAGRWDMPGWMEALDAIEAGGQIRLEPAIEAALDPKPDRLAIVLRMTPRQAVMEELAATVVASGVPTDVIQLGRSSPGLEPIAERTGGRYVDLPEAQITDWYMEYLERQRDE